MADSTGIPAGTPADTPAPLRQRSRRVVLRRTVAGAGWLAYFLVVAAIVYVLLVVSGR